MNVFWILLSSFPHPSTFSQPMTASWLRLRCRPTTRAQRAWRRQSPWWDRWKNMASRTRSWVTRVENSQIWTCRSRKTCWRSPQKAPASSASSSRCWCSRETAQVSRGRDTDGSPGVTETKHNLRYKLPASGFMSICLWAREEVLKPNTRSGRIPPSTGRRRSNELPKMVAKLKLSCAEMSLIVLMSH